MGKTRGGGVVPFEAAFSLESLLTLYSKSSYFAAKYYTHVVRPNELVLVI